MKSYKTSSLILVLALFFTNNLYAKEKVENIEEVLVIAQKTEENISKIPIAISYYDDISIVDRDIQTVDDIAKFTPSFTMMSNGIRGEKTPSMRGIHAEVQTYQLSTGLYIDGIPTLSSVGFDTIFDDIKSIQVLKGPQSTLYGKNAEVGAIVINTKQPGNEKEATVTFGLGSDSKKELKGKIAGPIIEDKLFISVTATHNEKDGFMKHKSSGKIIDATSHNYYKLNLRATPRDDLEISFMSSFLKYDDGANKSNSNYASDSRVLDVDLIGFNKTEQILGSLKVKYDISPETRIESITAFNKLEENAIIDGDATIYPLFHTHRLAQKKSYLQEFRLNQKFDNFNYTLGVDYNKLEADNPLKILDFMDPTSGFSLQNIDISGEGEDEAFGIFFHSNYSITNDLSLITGFRYDREKKSYEKTPDFLNPYGFNEKTKYSEISPKIALNYSISNNNIIYGNISKGYRPGGFNSLAPIGSPKTYTEEKIISYELGHKFIFDNFMLNSNIYFMDIQDMQVQQSINAQQLIIANAAEATSKGIEFDLNYRLTEDLDLFASAGFNEIKFDKFSDVLGDYSNNYSPNAPKYFYNFGLQYRDDIGYFGRIDVNGQGKVYADKQNQFSREAFKTVDIKLGYEQEKFDFYLYGKNIFDKKYDFVGYYGGEYTIPSEPREIGIKMTYRF